MSVVVSASFFKFLFVDSELACLDRFQSMLMKTMFAPTVLCSSWPVPCSVAAADVEVDHTDLIALLVEQLVKQKLKHGSSNCLSRSLHERTLQ